MKSLVTAFFTLFVFLTGISVKSEITIEVNKNNVTITNRIHANCCSKFNGVVGYSNYKFTITETDTTPDKCKCMCWFDLTYQLKNLAKGIYTVEILRHELKKYSYPGDTIYLLGTGTFEIKEELSLTPDWLFSISDCIQSSVESQEAVFRYATVYPNPTRNFVTLSFYLNTGGYAVLNVFDVYGKKVLNINYQNLSPGTNSLVLPAENLAPGVYTAILSDGNEAIRFPMIFILR